MALLRVLRASARDAYNSPRRRLLELDDGVAGRGNGRFGSLCAGYRPWTTQKALLAMVALTACCEFCLHSLTKHRELSSADVAFTNLARGIAHFRLDEI